MNAFSVRVTYADDNRLGWHTWPYYEKHELFVGESSRFVHALNAACLDSHELTTQFRDAVVAREHKKGHVEFEAEVIEAPGGYEGFAKKVEKHSQVVRAYLEKHGYPKPVADPLSLFRSGWVIRFTQEGRPGVHYLTSMKQNRILSTSEVNLAMCYKTDRYAQQALAKINAFSRISAVAIPLVQGQLVETAAADGVS